MKVGLTMRACLYCHVIQDELIELQQPKEKVDLLQLLVRPSLRLPLLISVVLHLSQQLTRIDRVSGFNSYLLCS